MLPTPHGPTDAPLPAGSDDDAVDTGRTPDEGALLRVVEHLADVPDGDADATAPPGQDAPAVVADDEAAPTEPAGDVDPQPAPEADAPAEPEVGPVAAALSDTRHRIEDLNAAEQLFLAQQRSMIIGLCPDPSDAGLVSALFDRVREQWTQAEDRPDLRPLADAFGVALGDLVCARAPHLTWATFSDRYGTEIVLARREPEVVVYPIAAVAQNWQEAAPGWLLRHLAIVVQGVSPELSSSDA